MNNKYDIEDFEKVINKELTVKEVAEKYGVTPLNVVQALNSHGYYLRKRIKIVSPFKTIYVQDKQKCAEELKVSRQTVLRALKGYHVPCLEELNITLEEVDDD